MCADESISGIPRGGLLSNLAAFTSLSQLAELTTQLGMNVVNPKQTRVGFSDTGAVWPNFYWHAPVLEEPVNGQQLPRSES